MRRYSKRNLNITLKENNSNEVKIAKNIKRSYKHKIAKKNILKSYTIDQVLNIFLHKNKTSNMIIESFVDLDACIDILVLKNNQTKFGVMNSKDYYLLDKKEREFFIKDIDENKSKNGVVAIINGMDMYINDKCPEKTLIFFGKNKDNNFIYGVENVDFSKKYVVEVEKSITPT